MRPEKAKMPEKPVVVGDRLFTNTSKRWIRTANLREDVFMVRRLNHIITEKRSAQQEYDYLIKSFKELWDRKLDKNRLTIVPEAKEDEEEKKEVAAYLRDVYSDTSSMGFDMSMNLNFLQSMSKKSKKKRKMKKIRDIDEEDDGEDEGLIREEGGKAGYHMASLSGLGKYVQAGDQDISEEAHGRLKSLRRPIKSAGDVKPPVARPALIQKSKSLSRLPDPDFRFPSPEVEDVATELRKNDMRRTSYFLGATSQLIESKVLDENLLTPGRGPSKLGGGGESVRSSYGGSSIGAASDKDNPILLNKLGLVPKPLPPIYQTKTKKPSIRSWDYPMAGSVRTPPDRMDRDILKPEITFSDQTADLKHCRYLRLPPNKRRKKKQEKPKKKERFIMVVAGGGV